MKESCTNTTTETPQIMLPHNLRSWKSDYFIISKNPEPLQLLCAMCQ